MLVTDFFYNLPEEKIAQSPIDKRDSSKLLTIDINDYKLKDNNFTEIVDYLREGDLLVFNDTRVIPARLIGNRASGAKIEVFLLKALPDDCWEVLVKPGRKAQIGEVIIFAPDFSCVVLEKTELGGRIVKFFYKGIFQDLLLQYGQVPLPPYIKKELADKNRYQTVYAKHDGSVAAPTAGLHFTEELFAKLKSMGIQTCFVTLHVGIGTFRPVSVEDILLHKMHSETYNISDESAKMINTAKAQGRRVIAVGTTAIRTIEAASEGGKVKAGTADTDIFIYPGYKFKIVDAIITNFHLPQSTLLMLVAAFMGLEEVLLAYKHAIEHDYRFFSFGDAMFIYNSKEE